MSPFGRRILNLPSHLISLLIISMLICQVSTNDYCEDEEFKAECGENEAVLIDTALYGRMRIGRCLRRAYGVPLGCVADVLVNLDRWCSGRQKCQVPVTRLLHDAASVCPKELRNYLWANYTCVPVVTAADTCYGTHPSLVTATEGYISISVAMETGCGSIDSPWLIQVGAGQRINVSLIDFSDKEADDPSRCVVYATLKERDSGAPAPTLCRGPSRVTHAYTSIGNSLEVRMLSQRQQQADGGFFLLHYKAIGCPDIALDNSWVERHGNVMTWGCEGSSKAWRLTCEGGKWVGQRHNCTAAGGTVGKAGIGSLIASSTLPQGLSVLIIVGVACLVGIIVLAIGVICLRNHYRHPRHRNIHQRAQSETEYSPHHSLGGNTIQADKLPPGVDPYRQNEYYRTWQIQQRNQGGPGGRGEPLPPPPYQCTNTGTGQGQRYSEHVYESPKFDRHELSPALSDVQSELSHVKYFELDPSTTDDGVRVNESSQGTGTSGYIVGHPMGDRTNNVMT